MKQGRYYCHVTSVPVGCRSDEIVKWAFGILLYQNAGINLRDIAKVGLAPNKGAASVNATVVSDMNLLLEFLS